MKRSLALSVIMLPALAVSAYAQTQSAKKGEGIEEIVVTAQKRVANSQRVGISITTVSGTEMRRSGDSKFENFLATQPSITLAQSGSGAQIYVRGLGTEEGFEPTVDFNVDGVLQAYGAQALSSFIDVERVEVLRGPQATLYGRNSVAGAVNVITRDPKLGAFSGGATLEIGNYNLVKPEGYLNIPLGSMAAFRFAGGIERRDGYLSNGNENANSYSYRGKLLLQPSDNLRIILEADNTKNRARPQGAALPLGTTNWPDTQPNFPLIAGGFTAGNGAAPIISSNKWTAPVSFQGDSENHIVSYHAQVDYDMGFATLTLLPSYVFQTTHSIAPASALLDQYDLTDKQTSIEARIKSPDGQRLEWIAGLYYFDNIKGQDNAFVGDFWPNNFNFLSPVHLPYSAYTSAPLREHWDSYAAFGQATYSVTNTLRLSLGARYTIDRKSANISSVLHIPSLGFGLILAGPFAPTKRWYAFDWHAEADWDVAPKSMLYAKADTGYKPGGFFEALAPNGTYKPEKVFAVEIGSKNQFLENRLQLNADFFWYLYKNKQLQTAGLVQLSPDLSVPPSLSAIVTNAGEAQIYGAELALVYLLTRNDRFDVGGSWEHTQMGVWKYSDPGAGFDYSFQRLPYAPEWTANVSYSHTFELNNGASIIPLAHMHWESNSWKSVTYVPLTWQRAWTRTDFNLSYVAAQSWSVTAYVKNIEDNAVMTENDALSQTEHLLAPRTFGVVLNADF